MESSRRPTTPTQARATAYRSNALRPRQSQPQVRDQTRVVLQYRAGVQMEFNAPLPEAVVCRNPAGSAENSDAVAAAQVMDHKAVLAQQQKSEKVFRFQKSVQNRVNSAMSEKDAAVQLKRKIIKTFETDSKDPSKPLPRPVSRDGVLDTKEVKKLNHLLMLGTMERQRKNARDWQEKKKRNEEEKQKMEEIQLKMMEDQKEESDRLEREMLEREAQLAKAERFEKEQKDRVKREVEGRERKVREEARYVEALRRRLLSMIEREKITVPHICSCGYSPLENLGQLCAMNCPFYQNPEAIAALLQNVLLRLGVGDRL